MRILICAAGLLLVGCSIPKTPEVVGGSQDAGIVRLGYSVAALQRADVDQAMATRTAERQCQAWGYNQAIAYGAPITHCALISGSGCLNEQVVMEYQCRGVNPLSLTAPGVTHVAF